MQWPWPQFGMTWPSTPALGLGWRRAVEPPAAPKDRVTISKERREIIEESTVWCHNEEHDSRNVQGRDPKPQEGAGGLETVGNRGKPDSPGHRG